MLLRHISFDGTEQFLGLQDYLATRCEVFLDFDPVPYPDTKDEPAEEWKRALNTTLSGG